MTSNSNIFYTRTLKSIFSSFLLTYVTALLLSLESILSFSFSLYFILYVPVILVAVSLFVIVISRKYTKTRTPSINRFRKIVSGLSIQAILLAALCSTSACFLFILNPFYHNEEIWYLLSVGCALTGVLFHYDKMYSEQDFHFPIIQTTKYSMFMSRLSEIILMSMRKSFLYMFLICIPLYLIEPKSFNDVYFFIILWFSVSLVLYFFYSFEHIVYLTMTERVIFPIVTIKPDDGCLLNALSSDYKIVKLLAIYDLYQATIKDAERRKDIFSLSFAGSVPQSWKIIFNFCINNIKSTTGNMTNLVEHVSPILIKQRNKPNARLINVIGSSSNSTIQDEKHCSKQNKLLTFLEKFHTYNYIFGSLDKEKTLEEYETTVWCCYIISNLAVVSLKEDEYGVVREHLGQIISTILDLKNKLELQRNNFDCQKIKNIEYLKIHIRTCAVMLALNFAVYANDIGLDETQLHSFKKLITLLNNC